MPLGSHATGISYHGDLIQRDRMPRDFMPRKRMAQESKKGVPCLSVPWWCVVAWLSVPWWCVVLWAVDPSGKLPIGQASLATLEKQLDVEFEYLPESVTFVGERECWLGGWLVAV